MPDKTLGKIVAAAFFILSAFLLVEAKTAVPDLRTIDIRDHLDASDEDGLFDRDHKSW